MYETTCDNYFIGKCLLKSNIARVILLTYLLTAPSLLNIILTYYKQNGAKTARISLATWLFFQIFDSILFPYFNSNILYSVHLLCIQWPFVMNLFSNNFFHAFDYFWKQVTTKLLISLCWHILHLCSKFWFCETVTVTNSVSRNLPYTCTCMI